MSITDPSAAAVAPKRFADLDKVSATTFGAGAWHSLWALGPRPPAGSAAGSTAGVIRSRSSTGALGQANPASGNKQYISAADILAANLLQVQLLDRLWDNSAISLNATGSVSITMPSAITRYTTGEGNIILAECVSPWGATPVVLTVDYTNSEGVAGRSATVTVDGNPVAGQTWKCALQAGDTGVQSIQGVSRSISSGAAGNCGLVIAQPITRRMGVGAGAAVARDLVDVWSEIADDACLYAIVKVTGASTGILGVGLEFREG